MLVKLSILHLKEEAFRSNR